MNSQSAYLKRFVEPVSSLVLCSLSGNTISNCAMTTLSENIEIIDVEMKVINPQKLDLGKTIVANGAMTSLASTWRLQLINPQKLEAFKALG